MMRTALGLLGHHNTLYIAELYLRFFLFLHFRDHSLLSLLMLIHRLIQWQSLRFVLL